MKNQFIKFSDRHLRRLVCEYLESHNLKSADWLDLILQLAKQACSLVRPSSKKRGDYLNICEYVKVKIIPGGSLDDSYCFSGIAFTKELIHKEMKRDIKEPRILLLNCAIE